MGRPKLGALRDLENRCGPQFGSDQRVRRGGHFEVMKRVKMLIIRWINDNGQKMPNWLKMVIGNQDQDMIDTSSFNIKWLSHIL